MDTPIVSPLKRCTKCGEEKPATSEYWHKNPKTVDGLTIHCKPCAIKRSQDRYERKKEEIKAKEKARREENREEINAKRRAQYQEDPAKRLEGNKKYRQENPEKIADGKKRYRQENLESEKAKRKKRYATNREEAIKDSKTYYRENKSAIRQRRRAYNRHYNTTHREERRLWAIEYYKRNPEKAIATVHRRLARKRGLPSNFTETQWIACLEYFNRRCAVCDRPQGLWHVIAADHWIALASPDCPGTVAGNMIPLCHGVDGCNNSKGAKDATLWLTEKFGKRKAKQILQQIAVYFEWIKQQE